MYRYLAYFKKTEREFIQLYNIISPLYFGFELECLDGTGNNSHDCASVAKYISKIPLRIPKDLA